MHGTGVKINEESAVLLGIDTPKMRISFKILIMNKENDGGGINTGRCSISITRS